MHGSGKELERQSEKHWLSQTVVVGNTPLVPITWNGASKPVAQGSNI